MQLMTHTPWTWLAATLCLSMSITGCGKQESDKPAARHSPVVPAASHQAEPVYPEGDVRRHFVVKAQPLLTENAQVKLWALNLSKNKSNAEVVVVKGLADPWPLVFAPDGTLYFLDFIDDNNNASVIVAIKPDNSSEIIAHSGVMGYAVPDGSNEKEPLYNTFGGLSLTNNGALLTLKNDAYPYEFNISTREFIFQKVVLPTGENFQSESDLDKSSNVNWQFLFLQSDGEWNILYNPPDKTWYKFQKGGKLEKIANPENIKSPDVYLRITEGINEHFGRSTTGPDGYIYAIEAGQNKNDPDRVIRIGDLGLSSLRKEASRVTIAEFKHGELTGALAFSPKGELAVGAKNAIYLVAPRASKPVTEKTP